MITLDWWSRFITRLAGQPFRPKTAEGVIASANYRLAALSDTLLELSECESFAGSAAGQQIRAQIEGWLKEAHNHVIEYALDPVRHRVHLQQLAAEVRIARELLAVFHPDGFTAARKQLDEDRRSQTQIKDNAVAAAKLMPTVGEGLSHVS